MPWEDLARNIRISLTDIWGAVGLLIVCNVGAIVYVGTLPHIPLNQRIFTIACLLAFSILIISLIVFIREPIASINAIRALISIFPLPRGVGSIPPVAIEDRNASNIPSETSEKLSKLPAKLEFPAKIKDKIRFDDSRKCLVYKGVMSKKQREVLLKLSPDKLYNEAIESLFQRSASIEVSPVMNLLSHNRIRILSTVISLLASIASITYVYYISPPAKETLPTVSGKENTVIFSDPGLGTLADAVNGVKTQDELGRLSASLKLVEHVSDQITVKISHYPDALKIDNINNIKYYSDGLAVNSDSEVVISFSPDIKAFGFNYQQGLNPSQIFVESRDSTTFQFLGEKYMPNITYFGYFHASGINSVRIKVEKDASFYIRNFWFYSTLSHPRIFN